MCPKRQTGVEYTTYVTDVTELSKHAGVENLSHLRLPSAVRRAFSGTPCDARPPTRGTRACFFRESGNRAASNAQLASPLDDSTARQLRSKKESVS